MTKSKSKKELNKKSRKIPGKQLVRNKMSK